LSPCKPAEPAGPFAPREFQTILRSPFLHFLATLTTPVFLLTQPRMTLLLLVALEPPSAMLVHSSAVPKHASRNLPDRFISPFPQTFLARATFTRAPPSLTIGAVYGLRAAPLGGCSSA
jgi:hypothetical protein